ncbi:ribosomal subunit interface protein, partial [bacterium F11]
MNIQIRGHRTQVQPRWRDHIFERLSKLDRFVERIIKVEYVLTSSHHHLKGNEFCRINAKVPRKTIAIKRKSESMIGAIDAASHVLERQVQNLWKDVK